jgi:imidazolonepropionase-like amidohydrolase
MKHLPLFLCLLYFGCTSEKNASLLSPPPRLQEIVFRAVNVVSMRTDTVLEAQDVVARNGVIASIGPTGQVAWSDDALVIDASGKFLMPGLAEMHAHVPPHDDLESMQEVLWLFALNGVTTIRGMLGHPRHLELRDKIRSGEIFGPRLYTAGPALAGDDIRTPDQAVTAVRAQKQAGYDFLKILMPPLSKECFAAVVATAHAVDMPFAGHVPSTVGVRGAIEAGYASIDHLDGFVESLVPGIENMEPDAVGLFGLFVADKADTTKIPALIEGLRARQIWVVPTQCLAERWFAPGDAPARFLSAPEMAYMSDDDLEDWSDMRRRITSNQGYDSNVALRFQQVRKQLVAACNKNGVGLLLGSDAPQVYNVPGFSVHHELQYLVEAGLTPYEALRTGTLNVGRFFHRPGLGVIEPGAVSDLLLLDSNPLADIRNTRSIAGVLVGDRWLSKAFIGDALEGVRKR